MPIIHHLKTWPEYFERIYNGDKAFEVRKTDRDFREGDFLVLKEYDPTNESYSGRQFSAIITFILRGGVFGIQEGYCVMSIKSLTKDNS